jgi:hypothetical protein
VPDGLVEGAGVGDGAIVGGGVVRCLCGGGVSTPVGGVDCFTVTAAVVGCAGGSTITRCGDG